jgi:putative sterol carrier protein
MSTNLTAKWLKAAQHSVNEDPAFKKLGYVDTKPALKVGSSAFLLDFSGFSCHGVKKISTKDLRDADYLIEMSPDLWQEFLAGRRRGDGPTLAELDVQQDIVKADNPREKQEFFRFHLSLQAFVDAGVAAA